VKNYKAKRDTLRELIESAARVERMRADNYGGEPFGGKDFYSNTHVEALVRLLESTDAIYVLDRMVRKGGEK